MQKEKQLPPALPALQEENGALKKPQPKKRELPKKQQPQAQPSETKIEPLTDARAKLAAKIVKLMDAVSNIPKDGVNQGEGWRYLTSEGLLRRVNPECVKLGLSTTVDTELIDWREKMTKSGMVWQICAVKVTVTITDQDTGYSMTTQGIGGGQSSGEKSFASAQTQGRKYAFMLALNIDTGDDPEGDEKSDAANLEPSAPLGNDGKKVKCATPDCDGVAYYSKDVEVVDTIVKVYFCPKCKKETRVKA